MNANKIKKTPVFLVIAVALSLSGCSKVKDMFSDTGLPPLKGQRISILDNQQEIKPNPSIYKEPITLPESWLNTFWPQAGGYPNHAMGQLELGNDLKKVWKADIGAGGDRRNPLIVQPIVAGDTVYTMDSKANVAAFDLKTGKSKWSVSTATADDNGTGALGGGLAYSSGKLYVTNGFKHLLCLNPAAGTVNWRATLSAPARSAPTAFEDRIYIITLSNELMVFSAIDGSEIWTYAGIANTTNLLGSVSPAVNNSVVVLPLSSGEIIGLRPENGQVVWGDNLSSTSAANTLFSIADIRGQPVIDQGTIYAASYSGHMVALDEISGVRIWQKEIGSSEMPWAAGETVFIIDNEQRLIAMRRTDGEVRWITNLSYPDKKKKDQPIWTGPVLAGGRLILASNQGNMLEIDPQTGENIKLHKDIGENIMIAPVVADKTLLLLGEDGNLVAYR